MHFFSVHLDEPEPLDVLVIEVANGFTISDALESFYRNDPRQLSVDAIIVRPPVVHQLNPVDIDHLTHRNSNTTIEKFPFLAKSSEAFEKSFGRVPGRPVHLLFSHDYIHYLSSNINPNSKIDHFSHLSQSENISVIDNVRRAEIDRLIVAGRAALPAMPDRFYRAPSGELSRSFLRIGNIQRSRAAVDALFFWLLPYLRNCSGIITDTWSIASTALNASRRLCSYRGLEEQPVPVEMLGSYFDGSPVQVADAVEHIERLLRLTTTAQAVKTQESSVGRNQTIKSSERSIIFLMSAISTGSLFKRVRDSLNERRAPIERISFVSIFALGQDRPPTPSLRDLSAAAGDGIYSSVDKATVPENSPTISIDPQTYFPADYIDVVHTVRDAQLQQGRDFVSRYNNASIVKVHRDTDDDGASRHHAVWIDTVQLIQQEEFKRRFFDALESLSPAPKLIITPMHEAALKLGRLALERIRNRQPAVRHLTHSNLFLKFDIENDREIKEAFDGLGDTDSLLILDDAFIRGTRIWNYRNALRDFNFNGKLHFVVAVARPTEMSQWQRTSDLLKWRPPELRHIAERNTVGAIESLPLPDWEKECPWCNEASLYRKFQRRELSEELRERQEKLEQSTHEGLETGLFLCVPGCQNLRFTRTSLFAPTTSSEAAVFAVAASSVQELRSASFAKATGKPALGAPHFPVATVLDCEPQVYSDSFLKACLVRAAKAYELNFTDTQREDRKALSARDDILAQDQTLHDVSSEWVLAKIAGKFPSLNLQEPDLAAALAKLGLTTLFGPLVLK